MVKGLVSYARYQQEWPKRRDDQYIYQKKKKACTIKSKINKLVAQWEDTVTYIIICRIDNGQMTAIHFVCKHQQFK